MDGIRSWRFCLEARAYGRQILEGNGARRTRARSRVRFQTKPLATQAIL